MEKAAWNGGICRRSAKSQWTCNATRYILLKNLRITPSTLHGLRSWETTLSRPPTIAVFWCRLFDFPDVHNGMSRIGNLLINETPCTSKLFRSCARLYLNELLNVTFSSSLYKHRFENLLFPPPSMAFTASDICKVRFLLISTWYTDNLVHTDHSCHLPSTIRRLPWEGLSCRFCA